MHNVTHILLWRKQDNLVFLLVRKKNGKQIISIGSTVKLLFVLSLFAACMLKRVHFYSE